MASKQRKWWIIILVLAVVVLGVLAYYKAKSKPQGIAVEAEEAAKRKIEEKVSASGKIFPEIEVKISSDVSGEIVELYVEEGDSVVAGQLLAKIDPEAFLSSVERGRASVNNAKANLATAEAQIKNTEAQKEQIQAQLTNAVRIHNRNIELKKDGVISEADFETSLSNKEALEANLKSAEASLESAKKSAEASRYMVKSAEASLKELQTSLNRTTIKAPTSGIVSTLLVEEGERVVGTIQMAGTEMMRIANLDAMEVQVDVSENDILRVEVNDRVDIEVDAYIDKVFKGTVTQIANSASNITSSQASLNTDQVTNFIVKVRIDPSSYSDLILEGIDQPFRPGMSATVDIYTEVEEDVITIPIQSVTVRDLDEEDGEENFEEVVFVMDADTAKLVKVETGIQDDEYIVIKSGIEEGQTVITGPYVAVSKNLEAGKSVRVRDMEEKEDE